MNSQEDTRAVIKVGSRKSELALIQTKHVITLLQDLFPSIKFEIHTMTTMGDRVLNKSLPKIGEKALFTKDLEDALAHGGVDFVVHSLKDLPTQLPCGMTIGAVLEREDARDALVLNSKFLGHKLQTLPAGSLIGTSSLRRSAQLSRNYSHLKVCDIRGNLNTRLAKLDAVGGKFSGIILANAGLVRMGWTKRVDQIIEPSELLYAVGQGALAVECRHNDNFVLDLLSKLCHFQTQCRILTERSFLKTLGGGCSAPVGINSVIIETPKSTNTSPSCLKAYSLKVNGGVWSLDGKSELVDEASIEFELKCGERGNLIIDEEEVEDEVDVSPTKRPKLSFEQTEKLKKSPDIIDESSCLTINKSGKNASEIVDIHGKVFDVCPYSGQSRNSKSQVKNDETHERENCTDENRSRFDQLKLPIGQDFMGECPVLTTEQKIEFEANGAKTGSGDFGCPVKGKTVEKSKLLSEEIVKCPFMKKQNETVKLIDYEANAQENRSQQPPKSLVDELSDVKLYCGIFCHNDDFRAAFDKCEELGINLANKLMSAGALEIMKLAQAEIHSKC